MEVNMRLLRHLRREIKGMKYSVVNGSYVPSPFRGCSASYSPERIEHSLVLKKIGIELEKKGCNSSAFFYCISHSEKCDGREIGDGWPKPTSFIFEMRKEGYLWRLYDNLYNRDRDERFDWALGRKTAEAKLY